MAGIAPISHGKKGSESSARDTGEKEGKSMSKHKDDGYDSEPLGDVHVIDDFLSRPED